MSGNSDEISTHYTFNPIYVVESLFFFIAFKEYAEKIYPAEGVLYSRMSPLKSELNVFVMKSREYKSNWN